MTLAGEGVYTWTVRSHDRAGNVGSYAAPAWVLVIDETAPGVPTPTVPLTGTVVPTNVVMFGWQAVGDNYAYPLSYTVVVTGSDGTPYGATVSGTTAATITLGADGVYRWSVRAEDVAGNVSGYSAPISFYMKSGLPGAPMLRLPANGVLTRTRVITLGWQDNNVPPMMTYTVYVSNTVATVVMRVRRLGRWCTAGRR